VSWLPSPIGHVASRLVAVAGPFDADADRLRLQLIASAVLILVLAGLWALVVHGITRHVDDSTVWYQARKVASYTAAILTVVGLLWIWLGALRQFGTFFGLLAAGLAIALQDLLKNIAGWLYILIRRPYRVDDRIEIDGVRGDVIDIRMFRTSLLEIGNWVDADQSTGRIVHVPNGKVLTSEVFNATEGFGYLWHELPVLITFESDWKLAEERFREILVATGGHTTEEAAIRIRRAARSYKIRYTYLTPTVYLSVRDSGILLTGRILVDVRRRRAVEQQIWRALLETFDEEPTLELAYPTTRLYVSDQPERPVSGPPPVSATPPAGSSGATPEPQPSPRSDAASHDARDVPRG
jgi:small-conductance mechanosensitive channel